MPKPSPKQLKSFAAMLRLSKGEERKERKLKRVWNRATPEQQNRAIIAYYTKMMCHPGYWEELQHIRQLCDYALNGHLPEAGWLLEQMIKRRLKNT